MCAVLTSSGEPQSAQEVEVRGGCAGLHPDLWAPLASHQHAPCSGSWRNAPLGAPRPPLPLLAAASGVPEKEHPEPAMETSLETVMPHWLSLGPALPFQCHFEFSAAFPPLTLPGGRGRMREGSLHPQTVASVRDRVSRGRHSCQCRPQARAQAQSVPAARRPTAMALHSAATWPVWSKGCWWPLHTRSLRHASGAPSPASSSFWPVCA